MKQQRTSRAAWRYLVLQIPGLVLFVAALMLIGRWVDLPGWLFWVLIVGWVAKDLALFPFVRKAYEPHHGENPMLGARGVAEDRLAPSGYVRIAGELWRAEAAEGGRAIERGETVRVRAVRGLTLIVEPEAERTGSEERRR